MAIRKKESDGEHPASHYLVVEDPQKPSTWHLRVKDADGSLNHRLMGAAWAALHGGYRGNKYQGPGKEEALRKLKRLYKREGMDLPGDGKADAPDYVLCDVAIKADADDWKLEVLGVPFGGPFGGRDSQGEAFTPETDLMMDIGDQRPVIYYHGAGPSGQPMTRPEIIGKATLTRLDERGAWFEVVLDKASQWAQRVWDAAQKGMARASTGSVRHLVRKGANGLISVWPVGELTLLDAFGWRQPINEWAEAVPLKALFDAAELEMPEAFAEAGKAQASAEQEGDGGDSAIDEDMEMSDNEKKGQEEGRTTEAPPAPQPAPVDHAAIVDAVKADLRKEAEAEEARKKAEEELRAKIREEVVEEVKASVPAWRGGFATKKETDLGLSDDAMKSFRYWIRTGDEGAVKAALQGQTDAEGGYLVPDDFYNQIIAKRDELAIARSCGALVIQTSLDKVNVPTEDTSHTKFAITAEEDAVDEEEPTFGQVALTIYKFTKLVKMSEELAADQAANLDAFLLDSFARALAATENYYHLVGTGSSQPQGVFVGGTAGLTLDSASTIGVTEIPELEGKLSSPYTNEAVWVMRNATLGVVRGLGTSTFRWYAPTPFGTPSPYSAGARGDLEGHPVYVSDSAAAIAASAKTMLIGNFAFYAIADRMGLTVQRLEELYAANGQIGLLAKFRQGAGVLQAEAFQYATHPTA